MKLTTYATLDIEVGEMVQVTVKDANDQKHFLSGTYLVAGVEQAIYTSNWLTKFTLERRGHQ